MPLVKRRSRREAITMTHDDIAHVTHHPRIFAWSSSANPTSQYLALTSTPKPSFLDVSSSNLFKILHSSVTLPSILVWDTVRRQAVLTVKDLIDTKTDDGIKEKGDSLVHSGYPCVTGMLWTRIDTFGEVLLVTLATKLLAIECPSGHLKGALNISNASSYLLPDEHMTSDDRYITSLALDSISQTVFLGMSSGHVLVVKGFKVHSQIKIDNNKNTFVSSLAVDEGARTLLIGCGMAVYQVSLQGHGYLILSSMTVHENGVAGVLPLSVIETVKETPLNHQDKEIDEETLRKRLKQTKKRQKRGVEETTNKETVQKSFVYCLSWDSKDTILSVTAGIRQVATLQATLPVIEARTCGNTLVTVVSDGTLNIFDLSELIESANKSSTTALFIKGKSLSFGGLKKETEKEQADDDKDGHNKKIDQSSAERVIVPVLAMCLTSPTTLAVLRGFHEHKTVFDQINTLNDTFCIEVSQSELDARLMTPRQIYKQVFPKHTPESGTLINHRVIDHIRGISGMITPPDTSSVVTIEPGFGGKLSSLLAQALQSSNEHMIDEVFMCTDPLVIQATMQDLPTSLTRQLLSEIGARLLSSKIGKVQKAIPWYRHLLATRRVELEALPTDVKHQLMDPIKEMIDQRASMLANLLQMKGKLELIMEMGKEKGLMTNNNGDSIASAALGDRINSSTIIFNDSL